MTSEGVVDLAMGRQKALRLTGRFKSPHLSLSLSSGLMRYYSTVVDPLVLTMFNAGHDLRLGGSVAFEFVRDQHARHVTKPLEQFAKEALRRLPVASALHENIKRGAVLVHRSPQVMALALDGQHDFVQMPFIAALGQAAAQFVCVLLTKLQCPLTNRFKGDEEAANDSYREQALFGGRAT
jgi:hypothetical protein